MQLRKCILAKFLRGNVVYSVSVNWSKRIFSKLNEETVFSISPLLNLIHYLKSRPIVDHTKLYLQNIGVCFSSFDAARRTLIDNENKVFQYAARMATGSQPTIIDIRSLV
jgi:hypothetical protein